MDRRALLTTLAKLDVWLETMRAPDGYGGPIAHWWESNFLFTGALFDWRYEGVIDGYRELYARTGQDVFLERSRAAANDILPQLLEDGRLRRSSFQFGPIRGGTPHEAAVDAALLKLVTTLRSENLDDGQDYLDLAAANLERYWIGTLWNGRGFQDQDYNAVLVANKHGTLLEALLEYEALTGRDCEPYIAACVRVIVDAQVSTGPQAGGIVHKGIGPSRLAIPIYTARAVNGLLSYRLARADASVDPVIERAVGFLLRMIAPKGVYWGIYGSGRHCVNPRMIAGAGDVLRLLVRLRGGETPGVDDGARTLVAQLIASQQPSGGLPTAEGFAVKGTGLTTTVTDLRDAVPVVGWVDKAFRALALCVEPGERLPDETVAGYDTPVQWRGRPYRFQEHPGSFRVLDTRGEVRYHWEKKRSAPDVYDL